MKGILWKVAKRLSYIEEARCLKVRDVPINDLSIKYFLKRSTAWS